MRKPKYKTAAVITIWHLDKVVGGCRGSIAKWLNVIANEVENKPYVWKKKKEQRRHDCVRLLGTRTTLALVTLNQPTKYSQNGARNIAAWLRREATYLAESKTRDIGKSLRMRFIYTGKGPHA